MAHVASVSRAAPALATIAEVGGSLARGDVLAERSGVRARGRSRSTHNDVVFLSDVRLGIGALSRAELVPARPRPCVSAVSASISSERVSVSEIVCREVARQSPSRIRVAGCIPCSTQMVRRPSSLAQLRANSRPTEPMSAARSIRLVPRLVAVHQLVCCAKLALRCVASRRRDCILDLSFRPHDSFGTSPRQALVDVLRCIEVMAS